MHFSLDVWNTIINPNKEYALRRNALLSSRIGRSYDETAALYTRVKTFIDNKAEAEGIGYSSKDVYRLLNEECSRVCGVSTQLIDDVLLGIKEEFEALFFRLPPHIPAATIEVIKKAQDMGHTFSISSNTNFITGNLIRKLLEDAGMTFSFYIFSDLLRVAKPNPVFFTNVANSYYVTMQKQLEKNQSIHIGDNPICDNAPNMMNLIISGPHELAPTIERLI